MKKLLSPLINFLSLLPIYAILYLELLRLNLFQLQSDMSLVFFIVIISVIVFLAINSLLRKIDRLAKPKISDHFRQSALLYLAVITLPFFYQGCVETLDQPTCHGALQNGLINLTLITAAVGILTNIGYLVYLKFKNNP
jgi:hypothetical protein